MPAVADLNDAGAFAGGPPHEVFAAMRAEAPVHWTPPTRDLPGYHSVLRFDDIVRANKDWRTFSSARDGITIREGAILPAEFSQFAFVFMDPPEHNQHRAILQKVFTAGAVAARADDIRAVARRFVDEIAPRGECDLVADLAARFPLVVTSNMLGVPEPDHGKLFAWTNALADTEMASEPKMQLLGEMFGYVSDLIAKRRADPQDDLITRLIHAEVDGQSLSDMDVVLHFVQITAGGNETTRDAFAGGMEALMARPDQRRLLLDDPSLVEGAVEEILRWHTPIHCMCAHRHHAPRSAARRSPRVTASSSGTARATGIPWPTTIPTASTSPAAASTTSPSAVAGSTTASETSCRASSCGSCSRRCCAACPTPSPPARPSANRRRSFTPWSRCQ
jgi:cytochrome P450